MKVLLIEDETGIANLICRGMEAAGYTVDAATDGKTGLRLALENRYGLIVLDLMLPGMDGWQICRSAFAP